MNTVSSARNPRWADQAHTSIVLWVIFEETKDLYGEVPFAASADDSEPHGVDLFNRAIAGEFGEILEPTEEMVMAHVMILRGGYSAGATEKSTHWLMSWTLCKMPSHWVWLLKLN